MTRPLLLPLVAALSLLGAPALADDWADTQAYFQNEGQSDALYLRARAFNRLAGVSEGQGVPLLMQRYKSPRDPYAEEERFLIGSSLRLLAPDDASQAAARKLLQAFRGRDPWVEYNVFINWDADALLAIARDPEQEAWRRAAAIQALAGWGGYVKETVEALAQVASAELPRKKQDLHLLAGALGAALLTLQRRDHDDPEGWGEGVCRPLVEALMGVLKNPKLPDSSQALLKRRLDTFTRSGGDEEDGADQGGEQGGTRVRGADELGPTSFMGITVEGRQRIVFVIDMSDSMLEKLSSQELDDLHQTARRGPVTGDGAAEGGGGGASDLPWERIRTRFDAARAFLVRALRQLDPQASFAVVGFGDEAALLRSTPKLVKASSGAVQAATAELVGIQPGAPTGERPLGTLRGQTNLHAAIRLAYRVSTHGVLNAEKCALPGNPYDKLADTIFVLSDGEPTRDDFPGQGPEREVKEGTVTHVDPETGRQTTSHTDAGTARSNYEGPYRDLEYFRCDLERLNLFRWAQVHVIGIGECDPGWGKVLARIGEGEFEVIGPGRD